MYQIVFYSRYDKNDELKNVNTKITFETVNDNIFDAIAEADSYYPFGVRDGKGAIQNSTNVHIKKISHFMDEDDVKELSSHNYDVYIRKELI